MKNYCCFFIVVLLVFCSCEKEESFYFDLDNNGLLKEVQIEDEVFYKYTYNNSNLILEEKNKYYYSKHNYNNQGQLVRSEHYWDNRIFSSSRYVLEELRKRTNWVNSENTERSSYKTFKYGSNGELKMIKTIRESNDYTLYSAYSYNEKGRIEKRTSYHDGKAALFDKYYYDAVGNLIREERYNLLKNGNEELSTSTDYEFDNMKNPYYSFRKLMSPGQNTNVNNIIKQTYHIYFEVDDFIDNVQVSEFEYEYNSNGYPVSRNDSVKYIYY